MRSTDVAIRRLTTGISILALLALGACGSSGHGVSLGGSSALGSPLASSASSDGETGTAEATGEHADGAMGGDWKTTTNRRIATNTDDGGDDGGGGGGGGGPTKPVQRNKVSKGVLITTSDDVAELAGGVLHTAGNALLVTPQVLEPVPVVGGVVTPILQTVGQTVADAGDGLSAGGVSSLPVVGSTVSQTLAKVDTTVSGVASVNVGGQSLTGGSTAVTPTVAVAALSSTAPSGGVVSAGVLSGGQTLTVAVGPNPATGTNLATNGEPNSLIGGSLGSTAVPGATAPVVALNVGSTTPTQGTLLTVGALSGGQPVSVSLGSLVTPLAATSPTTPTPSPVTTTPAPTAPAPEPSLTTVVASLTAPVSPVVQTVLAGLTTGTSNPATTPTTVNTPVTTPVVAPAVVPVVAPVVTPVVAPVVAPVIAALTPVVAPVTAPVSGVLTSLLHH